MLRRAAFGATVPLLKNGAGAKRSRNKRTHHNIVQWEKDKGNFLTYLPRDRLPTLPNFIAHPQRVEDPLLVPQNECCFNCKKAVDTTCDEDYILIPSGNARKPTKQGYLFHVNCFRCTKCRFSFENHRFYSKDDRAICLECAMGRHKSPPRVDWHIPSIQRGHYSSRRTGHMFPRHQEQMDFICDPDV